MQVVVAGFYLPAIIGIEELLGLGHDPEDVRVLTYDTDDRPRNAELLEFLDAEGIAYRTGEVSDADLQEWALESDPDVLFSLYYHDKVPMTLLDEIPRGGVNLHPSLLPEYKGTFAAPWAIINGEDETGITYHYMTEEFDAGNVVLQEPVGIEPDDTAYSLYHRLLYAGLSRFREMYERVVEEGYGGRPQTGEGSYYPRELPHDGVIDPDWDDDYTERFIRAMYFPGYRPAVVEIDGEEYEVRTMATYEALCERHGL